MSVVKEAPRQKKRNAATVQTSVSQKPTIVDSWLAYILLGLLTVFAYCRVVQYPFTNYDDTGYITENPHVQTGLSSSTIMWSLSSFEQSNWHPLTWVSHAVDYQLYGLDAGGHHATGLLLHLANVFLFFFLLRKATGDSSKSFFASALFALHPINVQSVAWIAERKNVLSTFFLLLALAAYGWYASAPDQSAFRQKRSGNAGVPDFSLLREVGFWANRRRYALVVLALACGLASKPMLVTLPLLLLILDYWPLRRVAGWTDPRLSRVTQLAPTTLVLEKLPLFLLCIGSAAVTIAAQKARGAVQNVADFPFLGRIENAALSYVRYVLKAVWPSHFAVYYPNPFDPTFVEGPGKMVIVVSFLSAAVILVLSLVAWRQRILRPEFTAGWAWFLISLLPVIGIVQVGRQAMADRYAYVPLMGVFVALAWGFSELAAKFQVSPTVTRTASFAVLTSLLLLTWKEVGHWSSSYELWSHALDVTSNNYLAEAELGNVLVMEQRYNEALPHYQRAAALDAHDPDSRVNIGTIYEAAGLHREAATEYQDAIRVLSQLPPGEAQKNTVFAATWSLANTYVGLGEYEKARLAYRSAREIKPDSFHSYTEKLQAAMNSQPSAVGYLMLGIALAEESRPEESASALRQAEVVDPRLNLARIKEEIGSVSR
jgi:tetratricopeptide (TPR) repeat protein